MLAPYLGLSRQWEILIIIFLGICFLSMDFSLFQIGSNLEKIWNIKLQNAKYLETALKYVISAIVLARTFTLHIFLAFYIVMLWPAIFEEKPNLMLPWLLLGIIRSLILNGISLGLGLLICQLEVGIFSPICFEYVLVEFIEHGPSVYAWLSILRTLRLEDGSVQSSLDSIICESYNESTTCSKNSQISENQLKKAYSDINMDFMYSSCFRTLRADKSIEDLINKLKELFDKKNFLKDGTKSLSSLLDEQSNLVLRMYSIPGSQLTRLEETMQILNLSKEDIIKARETTDKFAQVLNDISLDDITIGDPLPGSSSFYLSKSQFYKGRKTHIPLSHSQSADIKTSKICACYLKKQLELQRSNQTLMESEIANITLNETEKDGEQKAKLRTRSLDKKDLLNIYGVVGGSKFGFNPNVFLQKFVLKKNTSKNFGCQVSVLKRGFLEASRSRLVKKWVFLRNLRLSKIV